MLKLKRFMTEEKPFLNPSIAIQHIPDHIGIFTRELSVLINHQLGQHFYDFVNIYRIKYAMDILKDVKKNKVNYY